MATASMAMGEVQIAKREGHKVPLGTGLTKEGKETTDPGEIADGGVILPFGGYKGSSIAMMVELLAGALIGENFSFETAAKDNNDGGPPSGGEFIIAISPDKISSKGWDKHACLSQPLLEILSGEIAMINSPPLGGPPSLLSLAAVSKLKFSPINAPANNSTIIAILDPLYPPKGSITPPSAISPGSVVSLPSLVKPVPRGTLCPSLFAI